MKHKSLIVAGKFDADGGRPSGYAKHLFGLIEQPSLFLNGGPYELLEDAFAKCGGYDVVYWFADVPNDRPKLVDQIKAKNPKVLLVSSKNNIDEKYAPLDLIARALTSKSNLLVEFSKSADKWLATIMDPLGNAFAFREADIGVVCRALYSRVEALLGITRIGSERVGPAVVVPDMSRFFKDVQTYAVKFHHLVHAVH